MLACDVIELAPIALVDGRPDYELGPPSLASLLGLPLCAEARLAKRGWRLPAGVSIGMVCTRR
jgi:hypothetical protein